MEQNIDLKKLLVKIETLCQNIGEFIVSAQKTATITSHKDSRDIATTTDLEAERKYIEKINSWHPDHAIFSEEAGRDQTKSDYLWVIDPLDGTKEYQQGFANYSTCITLLYKNEPQLAVVQSPITGHIFSAAQGVGARLNGKAVTPAKTNKLKDAFVYSYLPTHKESLEDSKREWSQLQQLSMKCYRLRGTPQESLANGMVAAGKIEASIRVNSCSEKDRLDLLPGLFIAETAGAKISTPSGEPINYQDLTTGYVSSCPSIHKELIKALNNHNS